MTWPVTRMVERRICDDMPRYFSDGLGKRKDNM